jgi:hypothetical protein
VAGKSVGRPARSAATRQRQQAAGIYGTIITAAVLVSAGSRLDTLQLEISILVTLLVYWLAEVYARVLSGQLQGGRLPTWQDVRAELAAAWPMVSASFLPLLLLLVVRLAGASSSAAANAGLAATVLLLVFYGWSAGRAAGLRGIRLLFVTLIAAALGLLLILLKNVVLVHLH